jgi:hypothetical protein
MASAGRIYPDPLPVDLNSGVRRHVGFNHIIYGVSDVCIGTSHP